ncbi:MAG: class I SAM-dependent methyltransferase [Methylococcaceae bacterium]
MKRIVESELMEESTQAKAYSEADFEQGHSKIIQLLDEVFGVIDISGDILDLGCGSGDVTFRIAHRFPKAKITAVDGAQAMLDFAEERKMRETDVSERVNFVQAMIPGSHIPKKAYDLIISTSFLHHLHQPDALWQTIKEHSRTDTKIFIADLVRPENKNTANGIVKEFAKNEPEVLKEDYYNSLLAAFTPDEVKDQLEKANLNQLSVYVDGYLIVHGEIE